MTEQALTMCCPAGPRGHVGDLISTFRPVLLAPYSSKQASGVSNAKNYPHWPEVVAGIHGSGILVAQLLARDELVVAGVQLVIPCYGKVSEVERHVLAAPAWVCCDNYLHHLAHLLRRPGVVVFGPSDPKIYGHAGNVNLHGDRQFMRPDQQLTWDGYEADIRSFPSPADVVAAVVHQYTIALTLKLPS